MMLPNQQLFNRPIGGSAPSAHRRAGAAQQIDRSAPQFKYSSYTLILNSIGIDVNSLFPVVRRMSTINFATSLGIIGVSLSSSILSTGGVCGVYAFLDQGIEDTVSLAGVANMLMSHQSITPTNPAIATPASRTNSLFYSPQAPLVLPSGANFSIFAASENNAANQLIATATITYYTLGG